MSVVKGILHVNLTIGPGSVALAQAHDFYVGLLGLGELDRPAETDNGVPGYWLDCGGGQQIHLSVEERASDLNGPSKRHAAFQVDDLAGLRSRLASADVPLEDIGQSLAGAGRFFARDPWGNRIELIQFYN